MVPAAPPRGDTPAPVPLVEHLGEHLARRRVSYCQWKGHGKRERWASGRGDIDLLVDRAMWGEFVDVLAELGFKQAVAPPGREAAGVQHFFGLDERTGKLVHVHAYTRLALGAPWRTHYRLPLERALLESATQHAVFRAPAPELAVLVEVIRLTLRHEWSSLLRRGTEGPRWLEGARHELERLEEQAAPGAVEAARARHVPEIDAGLFERCRIALRRGAPPLRRLAARAALVARLRAHAAPAPLFAPAERLWRRFFPIGQRLAGGGSVVALLGADGAGKSTCARALQAWLAPTIATLHVHLGRPPRTLSTFLAGAALKLARRLGDRPALVAHLDLLRQYCTARDRFQSYRHARSFAAAGGIALCERYPTPGHWALAGPSEARGRALTARSALADWLRRRERAYYERMTHPDLVFILRLDPDTAVRRKPDEPSAYVRERAQLMWDGEWSGSGARVVDAAQPLPEVVAALKAGLWQTL